MSYAICSSERVVSYWSDNFRVRRCHWFGVLFVHLFFDQVGRNGICICTCFSFCCCVRRRCDMCYCWLLYRIARGCGRGLCWSSTIFAPFVGWSTVSMNSKFIRLLLCRWFASFIALRWSCSIFLPLGAFRLLISCMLWWRWWWWCWCWSWFGLVIRHVYTLLTLCPFCFFCCFLHGRKLTEGTQLCLWCVWVNKWGVVIMNDWTKWLYNFTKSTSSNW